MNQIAPRPEPAIRDIPLCRLGLAPEKVRKTPPDENAQAQLLASIKAHRLLENLTVYRSTWIRLAGHEVT